MIYKAVKNVFAHFLIFSFEKTSFSLLEIDFFLMEKYCLNSVFAVKISCACKVIVYFKHLFFETIRTFQMRRSSIFQDADCFCEWKKWSFHT